MNNWYSLLLLLSIIAIVWLFDRKNFVREGLFFLRRTEKGLDIIDSFAAKHKYVLKSLSDFGIVVSFGLLGMRYVFSNTKKSRVQKAVICAAYFAFSYVLIFSSQMSLFTGIASFFGLSESAASVIIPAYQIFSLVFGISGYAFATLLIGAGGILLNFASGGQMDSPMKIVAPIEVSDNSPIPVFYVPIVAWLVSILVILIVHEFSHAIISRVEGIRVNSMGYGFFAVLPLGFAEPDEKQLKKAKSIKKSRIFAAGSFSNLMFAAVLLIGLVVFGVVASSYVSDAYVQEGVNYQYVNSSMPASALPDGGVITHLNGQQILNYTVFSQVIGDVSPGDNITLTIDDTEYNITTTHNPDNESVAFIGIYGVGTELSMKESVTGTFYAKLLIAMAYVIGLLQWIVFLNIGIAIANLLPLKPLDGGLILEEILNDLNMKNPKKYVSVITHITLFLLLFALFGPMILSSLSGSIF